MSIRAREVHKDDALSPDVNLDKIGPDLVKPKRFSSKGETKNVNF